MTDQEPPREEARQAEIVFPNDTNPYGTMFGGAAYAMMDRAACLAANGYALQHGADPPRRSSRRSPR